MKMRTVAILRGYEPEQAAQKARACWEAGIDLVEVPVQGERGWAGLESVAACADGRPFGAGTILTVEDVRRSVRMGASVLVSPHTDASILRHAREEGVLALPGVMTPSDVAVAAAHGLTTAKLFPANVVGPGWITAMRGPFPAMGFVAVGGVTPENAADYLRAGACGVGLSTSIERLLATPTPSELVAALHQLARPTD